MNAPGGEGDPLPPETLELLVIPGSLREDSYNRALARSLVELLPDGAVTDVFELHDVPLYDADRDTDEDRPREVRALKESIDRSDGLLVVTPEYNYGVPGVLKNALDWASRPSFRSPMAGKPTGIMGASPGAGGTMRGQEQLKLILLAMAAPVFPHRGVAVTRAGEKFEEGSLVDESTRDFIREYLASYVAWVRRT